MKNHNMQAVESLGVGSATLYELQHQELKEVEGGLLVGAHYFTFPTLKEVVGFCQGFYQSALDCKC